MAFSGYEPADTPEWRLNLFERINAALQYLVKAADYYEEELSSARDWFTRYTKPTSEYLLCRPADRIVALKEMHLTLAGYSLELAKDFQHLSLPKLAAKWGKRLQAARTLIHENKLKAEERQHTKDIYENLKKPAPPTLTGSAKYA